MSLSNPSRRLVASAVCHNSSYLASSFLPFLQPSLTHRRTLFGGFGGFFGGKKRAPPKKFLDPLDPDYLKQTPAQTTAALREPEPGKLASSSIFGSTTPSDGATEAKSGGVRNPSAMATALDPKPYLRERWERKMIIRGIRTRHRMSKTVKIARTERVSLSKSHMLKTSLKKLGPLARQIAGKPIEDAIVQMRFSKKKAATDVKNLLELAKNDATARRGMGLGLGPGIVTGQKEAALKRNTENIGGQKGKAIVVHDRKGNRRLVTDPTSIYVDEAWVGRGSFVPESSSRGRGRVDRLKKPWTSITVVLKEEATRIRLAKEKELKRQRKKVWVQMPDRPITAQRQYCLW